MMDKALKLAKLALAKPATKLAGAAKSQVDALMSGAASIPIAVSQAQAAADIAVAANAGRVFATAASGDAVTTGTQSFLVQGTGDTYATLYYHNGSGGLKTDRALANQSAIDKLLGIYPDGGEYAFGWTDDTNGYYVPAIDVNGRALTFSPLTGYVLPVLAETEIPSSDFKTGILAFDGKKILPTHDIDGDLIARGTDKALPAQVTLYNAPAWSSSSPDALLLGWARDTSSLAIILLEIGQSNSIGQTDGYPGNPNGLGPDALVATTPIYPNYALMLDGGVRRWAGGPGATAGYVTPARSINLVPLVENRYSTTALMETNASGFANHFIRDIFAITGVYPTVVAVAPSIGGVPYAAVKRGSPVYQNIQAAVQDATDALRSKGFTRIRVIVNITGHESDASTSVAITPQKFVRQYQQLQRQLTADLRAITGDVEDPVFLLNQVKTAPIDGDFWNVPHRTGALDADGVGNIRVVGPMYAYGDYPDPNGTALGTLHLSCLGHNRLGQAAARAAVSELCGMGWLPAKPSNFWWTKADKSEFAIQVECAGSAIQADTSGDFVPTAGITNYGLDFRDGSVSPPSITAVSFSGKLVTVTLSGSSSGPRPQVRYATQTKGLICDNTNHISIYDSKASHNFMLAFIEDLPR